VAAPTAPGTPSPTTGSPHVTGPLPAQPEASVAQGSSTAFLAQCDPLIIPSMKVEELRKALKSAGLAVTGTKPVLSQRFSRAVASARELLPPEPPQPPTAQVGAASSLGELVSTSPAAKHLADSVHAGACGSGGLNGVEAALAGVGQSQIGLYIPSPTSPRVSPSTPKRKDATPNNTGLPSKSPRLNKKTKDPARTPEKDAADKTRAGEAHTSH
jgi:hypothetical protein